MKKLIMVVLAVVLLASLVSMVWAGEKEELALKWRALVAEYQLAELRLNAVKQDVAEFAATLESKGLMIQGNVVIEKPKPAIEKKDEPNKEGGKK